jgi:hypothetical protein
MINGERLELNHQPADHRTLGYTKTWDKMMRWTLDPDERSAFKKSATGYALSKHNKLSAFEGNIKEDGTLEQVRNVKLQVTLITHHIRDHDINDVLERVVVPVGDPLLSPDLKATTYNVLTDFRVLTKEMVAMSNAWYNTWPRAPYVRENLAYTFTFLCLEDYEKFHKVHQGGPLMVFLILTRIQNKSEAALQTILKKAENLKIRDLPAENVHRAVSLLRATYQALKSASTEDRNYIPTEFNQSLLKVFQTSTVRKFNGVFAKLESDILQKADLDDALPAWPATESILSMAVCSYERILNDDKGGWNVSSQQQKKALAASTDTKRRSGTIDPECWNCLSKEHNVNDCTQQKDNKRIHANRKKWMDKRKAAVEAANNKKSVQVAKKKVKKTKIGDDGTPLVLNVKNQWVPDQKAKREQQVEEHKASVKAMLQEAAGLKAGAPATNSSESDSQPEDAVSAHMQKVDNMVHSLFG